MLNSEIINIIMVFLFLFIMVAIVVARNIYLKIMANENTKNVKKEIKNKFDNKRYDKKYLVYIGYNSNIGSYSNLSLDIEEKIKEHDYNFRKEDVLNFVESYLNSELTKKIKLNSSNIYDENYINEDKKLTEVLNISNDIDRVVVDFISFNKYYRTKEDENIEIVVKINLYDVIENSDDKFYDKRLIITLNRKLNDIVYDEKVDLHTLTCDSCGGKLKVDGNVLKCQFCGVNSILKYGTWKISNVEEIQ